MTGYNANISRAICCPKCGHLFAPSSAEMGTLTPKQRGVLTFLTTYITVHQYAPSFEEIAAAFGYTSLATVHEHLTTLERKGYIMRSYNESRAITILEPAL